MDILVKSFNRPYYLDRCLQSIYKLVKGDFTVKILDDGTPAVYLTRILEKYPNVQVLRSPQYERKTQAIAQYLEQGIPYHQPEIPTAFWIDSVANSSPVFLLLEDDIWLTQEIDLDEVSTTMAHHQLPMLRLSWQGNAILVAGKIQSLSQHIEQVLPSINWVKKGIFMNKGKVRAIGYRLGFFRNITPYQLPLYVLYAVAGAFFTRDYWLHLWEGAGQKVLEEAQLRKAAQWYEKHRSRYGKMKQEGAETSYITSTHNGFVGIDFDMMQLNHLLNEAWLNDELDAGQGLPRDFSIEYLQQFMPGASIESSLSKGWLSWIEHFKNNYRKVGCRVD
jgi:hypothetical protein